MKKNVVIMAVISVLSLCMLGCGAEKTAHVVAPKEEVKLSEETLTAMDELNAIQINYSNGTAPLNIIPVPTVEAIYNDWEAVLASGNETAPISIREYVDPDIVYFDYSTDFSVRWEKATGDIRVEPTDVTAREDYKQKQHK